MCPLWPLHLIILYLLALFPLWVICQNIPNAILKANFTPPAIQVNMDEYYDVNVTLTGLDVGFSDGDTVYFKSERDDIASTRDFEYQIKEEDVNAGMWSGILHVYGNFLGYTHVAATARVGSLRNEVSAEDVLDVTVVRPQRVIDTVFTSSVAAFVTLIFVNFGCAMHWPTVKDVLKKPIGPVIAMIGQFIFMPLISFGLGLLIFPNDHQMRLGMFFTGVSPGGGASNIWTFILGGNLNLSLAMTTISTIMALGLMPAWLFSLGQVIFANANIQVPYVRILTLVLGLIIPLAIGVAMQKYTPRVARFMVRILKAFSTILLLFIIVFAIVTNLYIFQLFTWQIYVAGMGIPWLGYLIGYVGARVCRQCHADALAICIEVGNQNTGIAIFLLRYALGQPDADLTTVIPVSVAIMTPVPMMAIYLIQKIYSCVDGRYKHKKIVDEDTPVSETFEPTSLATIEGMKENNNEF